MEKAMFSALMSAVKPNDTDSDEWKTAWKSSPENVRAIIDYLRDNTWWPRIKKMGDELTNKKISMARPKSIGRKKKKKNNRNK